MSTLTERWAVLRDREALGEVLSPSELEDACRIENTDAEVRAHVMQMRELEDYLEGKREDRPSSPDHQLVLRALSAVQLSSPSPRVQAIDHDAELSREADPEGPGWIRLVATAFSVAMTIAAALALMFYEPRSLRRNKSVSMPTEQPLPTAVLAPQVEALLNVRTSERGARLRREGQPLPVAALLSQGDEISAVDKAGCFLIEAKIEICLGLNSTIKLKDLSKDRLALDLWRGRVTLHVAANSQVPRLSLASGEARLTVNAPGTFGVERNDDASVVRVRTLRGRLHLVFARAPEGALRHAESEAIELLAGQAVLYRDAEARARTSEPAVEVVDLLPGFAQREWELASTGRLGAAHAPVFAAAAAPLFARAPEGALRLGDGQGLRKSAALLVGSADASATAAGGAEAVSGGQPAPPRALMEEAWEMLKAERWLDAAAIYARIAREAPQSEESHIVLVRLGDLLLERLADPEGALGAFDRYLREGGGPLAAEARYGRIAVFRRLARPADERTAIEEFLRFHPMSTHNSALEARLKVLAPEPVAELEALR